MERGNTGQRIRAHQSVCIFEAHKLPCVIRKRRVCSQSEGKDIFGQPSAFGDMRIHDLRRAIDVFEGHIFGGAAKTGEEVAFFFERGFQALLGFGGGRCGCTAHHTAVADPHAASVGDGKFVAQKGAKYRFVFVGFEDLVFVVEFWHGFVGGLGVECVGRMAYAAAWMFDRSMLGVCNGTTVDRFLFLCGGLVAKGDGFND